MRAKSDSALTLTERARRDQIVRAAIDTIAELDYSRATFTAIARKARLSSTGMISYHFAGKQDLMDAVMRTILAEFAAFVMRREDDGTPAGGLAAFIEANGDFMREHRHHMVTMLRIQAADPGGGSKHDQAAADRAQLAKLLADGQRERQFRAFDTDLMAGFILSLRDGVIARLAGEPDLDLAACTTELLTVIKLATDKGATS